MQATYMDEDERDISRKVNTVGAIICTGEINKCLKEKHAGGLGGRITGI